MDLEIIFMIGPQGSGKGTQAKMLAERLGFFHWNMGEVCREKGGMVVVGGKTVSEIIDNGTLLTDEQLIQVFEAKAHELPRTQGIIFDGIPRRMGQARYLMEFLKQQGRKKFLTILLDIPKEYSLTRLMLRAKVEGRADDTEEGILWRLRQYEAETAPVLDYLRSCTNFITIDGRPPIPEVTKTIFGAFGL